MPLLTNIVFLDRSVLESENFFHSLKIRQLSFFAKEGLIDLKMTEVTYREILKGFKDNLIKSKKVLKQLKKDLNQDARILRNISKYDSLYKFSVDIDKEYKELCNLLEDYIKTNKIEILDNSHIEVDRVIDDYFEERKPFGDGQKKHEFPDAFILSAIEKYSTTKDIISYILSKDKDIIEYISPSGRVIPKANTGEFIGEIIKQHDKSKFNFIDARAFQENYIVGKLISDKFYQEFEDEVSQIVSENPFYEDVEFSLETIEAGHLIDHSILEILDKNAIIEYRFNVYINTKVEYNDLSTGYYDKEDSEWWGVDHIIEEIAYNCEIRITINHSFDLKKNLFSINNVDSFEIESIDEE